MARRFDRHRIAPDGIPGICGAWSGRKQEGRKALGLKVIGAGLGRTGTLSLKRALEILGFGPCYHMEEIVRDPSRAAGWVDAGRGRPDWHGLFAGYQATVDWPAASWWRQLAATWPQAKIILSVRDDADAWFASTQRTIFNPRTMDAPMPHDMKEMIDSSISSMFDGRINDRERCLEVYEAHNDAVRQAIAPERLLVFRVEDGWDKLCSFLDRPVPDRPFPRSNDAGEFRKMLVDPADR